MYEVFYCDLFGRTRMRFDHLESAKAFAKKHGANVWRERDGRLMASYLVKKENTINEDNNRH